MRKLVYEIENGTIVNSYKEAQEAKENGFKVKEKIINIDTEITGRKLLNKVLADKKKAN